MHGGRMFNTSICHPGQLRFNVGPCDGQAIVIARGDFAQILVRERFATLLGATAPVQVRAAKCQLR